MIASSFLLLLLGEKKPPLGLSKLTSDPRSAIRKSALEVLFNILKDHGSLFSRPFWNCILKFVVFPIFRGDDEDESRNQLPPTPKSSSPKEDPDMIFIAAERLVDLFVTFFSVLRSQLPVAVSILTGFIKSPGHGPAKTGVAALERLTGELGSRLSEEDWRGIFMAVKDAATSTLPAFEKVLRSMDNIDIPDASPSYGGFETPSDQEISTSDLDDDNLQNAAYVVSRLKSHIAVQLVIIQVLLLYQLSCSRIPLPSIVRHRCASSSHARWCYLRVSMRG